MALDIVLLSTAGSEEGGVSDERGTPCIPMALPEAPVSRAPSPHKYALQG